MIPSVRAYDRDRMSLLGLAMEASLQRALASRNAPSLKGTIGLEAGGMALTIKLSPGSAELRHGLPRKSNALLRGDLVPLVELAAGNLPVAAFMSGRVRVSGNLRLLWGFARLLRAGREQPA